MSEVSIAHVQAQLEATKAMLNEQLNAVLELRTSLAMNMKSFHEVIAENAQLKSVVRSHKEKLPKSKTK